MYLKTCEGVKLGPRFEQSASLLKTPSRAVSLLAWFWQLVLEESDITTKAWFLQEYPRFFDADMAIDT